MHDAHAWTIVVTSVVMATHALAIVFAGRRRKARGSLYARLRRRELTAGTVYRLLINTCVFDNAAEAQPSDPHTQFTRLPLDC